MAQLTNGLYAVLSAPAVYELLQNIMGAKRARMMMVRDYIRPFAGMRILDLGCGTAEILDYLPQDVTYVGYDVSEAYINSARAKFKDRGTFHCGLLETVEANDLESFDLVMGVGVLHHLDDGAATRFMELAKTALKPTGRLMTRDPCYEVGQNLVARFLIGLDRGQNVRTAMGYEALAKNMFSRLNGEITHQRWIPYTHWTMECYP